MPAEVGRDAKAEVVVNAAMCQLNEWPWRQTHSPDLHEDAAPVKFLLACGQQEMVNTTDKVH